MGVDAALDYKDKNFKKNFRETVGYFDAVRCHFLAPSSTPPKGQMLTTSGPRAQMFDNVGGEILDFALTRMKKFARIARESRLPIGPSSGALAEQSPSSMFPSSSVCGAIS